MVGRAHIHVRRPNSDRFASCEDVRRIFSENLNGPYLLSFLLTVDPEKAERCFVSNLEDCATVNPVFREWAHSCAKRTIIQNAIEELKPRPGFSILPLSATISPTLTNFRVVQAAISKSMQCWGLRMSSGLCSSPPFWRTTRSTTVSSCLAARFGRFGKPVFFNGWRAPATLIAGVSG